jgi:Na+-translocating ferredoxin:NAD+ oxidoreductase RnfD subunit
MSKEMSAAVKYLAVSIGMLVFGWFCIISEEMREAARATVNVEFIVGAIPFLFKAAFAWVMLVCFMLGVAKLVGAINLRQYEKQQARDSDN